VGVSVSSIYFLHWLPPNTPPADIQSFFKSSTDFLRLLIYPRFHMDNLAQIYQPSGLASTEGLDQFFAQVVEDQDHGQAITIVEAAERLNITRRSVLRLIHEGKLDGAKDGHGQWIIKTSSIETRLTAKTQPVPDSLPLAVDVAEVQDVARPRVDEDQDEVQDHGQALSIQSGQDQIMRELLVKVEALTFRNGYLEAQLEAQREQIKLLTDSQHKPSWWANFASWFMGRR
jgi:excisionase family DNA binding protein